MINIGQFIIDILEYIADIGRKYMVLLVLLIFYVQFDIQTKYQHLCDDDK